MAKKKKIDELFTDENVDDIYVTAEEYDMALQNVKTAKKKKKVSKSNFEFSDVTKSIVDRMPEGIAHIVVPEHEKVKPKTKAEKDLELMQYMDDMHKAVEKAKKEGKKIPFACAGTVDEQLVIPKVRNEPLIEYDNSKPVPKRSDKYKDIACGVKLDTVLPPYHYANCVLNNNKQLFLEESYENLLLKNGYIRLSDFYFNVNNNPKEKEKIRKKYGSNLLGIAGCLSVNGQLTLARKNGDGRTVPGLNKLFIYPISSKDKICGICLLRSIDSKEYRITEVRTTTNDDSLFEISVSDSKPLVFCKFEKEWEPDVRKRRREPGVLMTGLELRTFIKTISL